MLSTGFTDAPVSRSLAFGIVTASILVSITDSKHYFYIQVDPHLWRYHQLWRIFTYELCYTNSTEVLFAAMTLYNMRVIERLWGSRKFAVSCTLPSLEPNRLIADICQPVLHPAQLLLHSLVTADALITYPATALLQYAELFTCRANTTHIRRPRPIPCRHPAHLQIPSRNSICASNKRALRGSDLFRQIIRIPSCDTVVSLAIPRLFIICFGGMGCWIFVAKRCFAWCCDSMENTGLDGWDTWSEAGRGFRRFKT